MFLSLGADAKSAEPPETGFAFGSYGRVGVGTDLNGATPRSANVVAHGPRLVEPDYVELDLRYGLRATEDLKVNVLTTLALGGNFFHYTGRFDVSPAIRNLFAEVVTQNGNKLWVGSRMYRGGDIYLLDFWPVDDLNTVGAGGLFRSGDFDLSLQVGANRLLNELQYDEVEVSKVDLGATTFVQLDRQRYIATVKPGYKLLSVEGGPGARGEGYLEVTALPAGSRKLEDGTTEQLPSDFGWAVGATVTGWGIADTGTFGSLFAKYARGLSAFDELSRPTGFDPVSKLTGAGELTLGVSANYAYADTVGVLVGGYVRQFNDADTSEADRDDLWEGVIDVRPYVRLLGGLQAALDLSYQKAFPRGVSPVLQVATEPGVIQAAPMLVYAPLGLGFLNPPTFRLVYRLAYLDEGARDLYVVEDPRRYTEFQHYLGVQVEWWFNSSLR